MAFFDPSDGIEEEMCNMLNSKIEKVQEKAEVRIESLLEENKSLWTELRNYQLLKPESIFIYNIYIDYSILEMSLTEIFIGISYKTKSPELIWETISSTFSPNFFTPILISQFGDLTSATKNLADTLITYRNETEGVITSILSQKERRIAELKKEIDEQKLKVGKAKLRDHKILEIEKQRLNDKWEEEIIRREELINKQLETLKESSFSDNEQERGRDLRAMVSICIHTIHSSLDGNYSLLFIIYRIHTLKQHLKLKIS